MSWAEVARLLVAADFAAGVVVLLNVILHRINQEGTDS